MPARNCSTPSCPHPAEPGGRCTSCAAKARRAYREKAADSYTVYRSRRWRKLRRQILDAHPYCQIEGCDRPATDVDHVRRIEDGGDRWDPAGLQALCRSHHSAKTAKETGFGGRHD